MADFGWSPDRRYLAVLERHTSKEHIGIYDRSSLVRVSFASDPESDSSISRSTLQKAVAFPGARVASG